MEVLPIDKERIFGFETEFGIHPMPPNRHLDDRWPCHVSHSDILSALPPNLTMIDGGNGMTEIGRIYADQMRNIEFASPELFRLPSLLATYIAAEEIVEGIVERRFNVDDSGMPDNTRTERSAVKRCLDSEYNRRGDHENYFTGGIISSKAVEQLNTHLATRAILTGCGLVAKKLSGEYEYAIDQRTYSPLPADHPDRSYKAFYKYPKDNSLASLANRLEITSGSHNRFAYPIAARFFNTSSVMRLIEHKKYPFDLHASRPEVAAKDTARYGYDAQILMTSGRKMRPSEVQYELMTEALTLDIPEEEAQMARLSAEISADISAGKADKWATHLEHEAKLQILRRLAEKALVPVLGPTTAMLDIRWHMLGRQGIFDKVRSDLEIAMMPGRDAIEDAKSFPMDPTRAQKRSRAIIEAKAAGKRMQNCMWWFWQVADEEKIIAQDPYDCS